MDSITQAALGGLCGELSLGKKLGWRAAAWGMVFGTFPDLDVIGFYWWNMIEQLRYHRGLSHSLLAIITMPWIFGWLIYKIHAKRKVTYKQAVFFVFLAWSTHVLIDCFNTYGTPILLPFSDHRFAIGNIFIIDLFFTLPMLIGLITAICISKKPKLRRFIGWSTTTWLCLYFIASLSLKFHAQKRLSNRLANWGVTPKAISISPSPSNIFMWRMVARDEQFFYIGYYSIFDKPDRNYDFHQFAHGHELAYTYRDSPELSTLKWFSKGWWKAYEKEDEPDTLYIAAMNLGEIRTLDGGEKNISPAFLFKIKKTPHGYDVERPFKSTTKGAGKMDKAMPALIDRIKGNGHDWMDYQWEWKLKK